MITQQNAEPSDKLQMTTVTAVLEKLRMKKMDNEFRLVDGKFQAGRGKNYSPDELTIIKTFRFEGESDPSDSSIIYIIEANDGLIGYSMDAYGVYSNHDEEDGYDNFIRTIKVENRDEQLIFEI
ncbi:hypothetical protein [Flavitalea sp.]|nr:hypothetical protein [Flavitalea sp.]